MKPKIYSVLLLQESPLLWVPALSSTLTAKNVHLTPGVSLVSLKTKKSKVKRLFLLFRCEYDWLVVSSSSNREDDLTTRVMCGSWNDRLKLLRYVSLGPMLWIWFGSDHSKTFPGVLASYTLLSSQGKVCIGYWYHYMSVIITSALHVHFGAQLQSLFHESEYNVVSMCCLHWVCH